LFVVVGPMVHSPPPRSERERERESKYFCLPAPRTRTTDAVNLHPRVQT
jgi:hypothetical protein